MAGLYHPRHPERTVLYRVLFHYFDRFLAEYESRFEKQYGFLRSIVKEVTAGHHEARRAVVISEYLAKPPPAHVFEQTALMAAEESVEYE